VTALFDDEEDVNDDVEDIPQYDDTVAGSDRCWIETIGVLVVVVGVLKLALEGLVMMMIGSSSDDERGRLGVTGVDVRIGIVVVVLVDDAVDVDVINGGGDDPIIFLFVVEVVVVVVVVIGVAALEEWRLVDVIVEVLLGRWTSVIFRRLVVVVVGTN